jgi:hypothetical protein
MHRIEPKKTGAYGGWQAIKSACAYLDLILLHSAAVFKNPSFEIRRGSRSKSWSTVQNLAAAGLKNLGGALLGKTPRCTDSVKEVAMSKTIRDGQVSVRLSNTLRAALEDEATTAGDCGLSSIIRKILVDHAARRITARAGADTVAAR